jgi:hypothetical protein
MHDHPAEPIPPGMTLLNHDLDHAVLRLLRHFIPNPPCRCDHRDWLDAENSSLDYLSARLRVLRNALEMQQSERFKESAQAIPQSCFTAVCRIERSPRSRP